MIGEAFEIKQNDTRARYIVALKDNFGEDDEVPLDLTDATSVKFLMRIATASDPTVPKVTDTIHCVITDAVNGIVTYTWQTGDLDTIGDYHVEFQITWNDGGIQTVPNGDYFGVTVMEDLG